MLKRFREISRGTIRERRNCVSSAPTPVVRSFAVSAAQDDNRRGVLDTIQKPYDFNELLAKIRDAIGPEDEDDHPKLF
jgi:FixJ family two-component response regulator